MKNHEKFPGEVKKLKEINTGNTRDASTEENSVGCWLSFILTIAFSNYIKDKMQDYLTTTKNIFCV